MTTPSLFASIRDLSSQHWPDSPPFSPNLRAASPSPINLSPSMPDPTTQNWTDSPPFPPNRKAQSSPAITKKSIKQLRLPMRQEAAKRLKEEFSGTVKVTILSAEKGTYKFTSTKSSTDQITWSDSLGELACETLHKIVDNIQKQHPCLPIKMKCLFKPAFFEVDITRKLRNELMLQYFDFLRTNRLDKAHRCLKLVESISTYALRNHLSYSSSHSWHKK
ncbi:MAG: hypothetical protein WCG42_10420 [Parachlamydiaceae bacterium]